MKAGVQLAHDPQGWKHVFFPVWGSQAFSLLGSQLVQFALIWYLTQTTGSATVLATASLVGLLPAVFLGPISGALVDRWNRQVVMIVADASVAAGTAVLIALFAAGAVQVWHIYAILCLRSIGQGLHNPAMLAATPLMVPEDQLTRIQGLNQALEGILAVLAAPLGALLLGLLPMQAVLSVDIVTAAIAIAPLCLIRIPVVASAAGKGGVGAVLGDLRAGFRYVFSWRGLALVVFMASLINMLISPAFALLPLFVKSHLGGGAMQLGWLNALLGVGMLAGGVFLGVWGGFKRRVLTSMAGLLGMGLGLLLMGLTPGAAMPVAAAAMFVLGLALPLANGPLMAIIQATVDPTMQGRVISLMLSVSVAAAPLGLAVAGPLADTLGVQTWFLAGGVLCVLMGIGLLLVPSIAHLEDGRPASLVAAGAEGSA